MVYREVAFTRPRLGLADPVLVRWSDLPRRSPYQRIVATASNPGPVVGGIEVDVNDVLVQDCGQWNLHP